MTITFTRDTLRAAYNYLNETPPFNRWNLPDGDDVVFRVVRDPARFGWYLYDNKRHIIGLSSTLIGHTDTLMRIMAHEMVHVHERHSGACSPGHHGKTFQRFAAQVCKYHGFDPKAF